MSLAVVIITLNEERNIARCLTSVQGLADEIIVLDAFSTDKTQEICESFGVKFVQHEWLGYSASKNYLNALVTSDYILSLDADEALSKELFDEILAEKSKGFKGTYSVNRLTNYLGKWIYHSGWFPDIKPRLFPKEGSYWSGEYVHEVLVHPAAEVQVFKGILEHYSYYSYKDHRARADKYSYLTAQKFHAAGKQVGPLKPYISAAGRFIAMYFLKKGFLDGKMGFKIAQISAQSNVVKYKELRRLIRRGGVEVNKNWAGKRILISRTDSIGDVLLTLPITAWLKEHYPTCHITFLCKAYTAPIVRCYSKIDEVLILDELEKQNESEQIATIQHRKFDAVIHVFPRKHLAKLFKNAGVPFRVGTSHRIFHWLTCNVRPNFTRKKSPLHEAQLNFELLRPFGLQVIPTLEELNKSTANLKIASQILPTSIPSDRKNGIVVLHPKSQGSAREWPIEKYVELAKQLIVKDYVVCFTGTEKEGELFRNEIPNDPNCIDTTGLLSIEQLLFLIKESEALVACSTGPLHIAGYAGIRAIGLFAPKIPIHPGRWKPLGIHSIALVFDPNCVTCSSGKPCNCIENIPVSTVLEQIVE